MEFEKDHVVLRKERRLVSTMITGKPDSRSLIVTFASVLFIALVTGFYWKDPVGWSEFLPAVNSKIFSVAGWWSSEWWRIFTAVLIHADVAHFLSNMYMLGVFSFFIFGYFGFKVFPFWSFLLAGLVNAFAIATYPAEVRLLGASGLVYMLGAYWLTMYFFIQRQYRIFNRLLRIIGVTLVVFLPSTFVPTTSYRTHGIGFVVGVLMALVYFFKNKKMIRSFEVYDVIFIEDDPTFH